MAETRTFCLYVHPSSRMVDEPRFITPGRSVYRIRVVQLETIVSFYVVRNEPTDVCEVHH